MKKSSQVFVGLKFGPISWLDLGKVNKGWVWSHLVQYALLRHLVLLDNLQRERNQITCLILFKLHFRHMTKMVNHEL